MRKWTVLAAMAALAVGCNAILGVDDPTEVNSASDAAAETAPIEAGGLPVDAPAVDGGCWDPRNTEVVDNPHDDLPKFHIPDPASVSGVAHPARYSNVAGGTLDLETNLTWLPASADAGASGTGLASQPDAVVACMRLGGGARLPTRMELVTLQNWATDKDPGVDPGYFQDTLISTYYWSSTASFASTTNPAHWGVAFNPFGVGTGARLNTTTDGVRCVRSAATPPPPRARYVVSKLCGLTRDMWTDLEWERGIGEKATYEGSVAHCAALTKAYPLVDRPFRIPTYPELSSIVLTAAANPAIDTKAFASESTQYTTSSENKQNPGVYPTIDFSDGQCQENRGALTPTIYVRCVRTLP